MLNAGSHSSWRSQACSILQPVEYCRMFCKPTTSSCSLFQRRCSTTKDWLSNYGKRVDIRIGLVSTHHLDSTRSNGHPQQYVNMKQVFHLANQDQAALTRQLAEDSFKDSSSMTTISAMTLFFLPSTFICVCVCHPGSDHPLRFISI